MHIRELPLSEATAVFHIVTGLLTSAPYLTLFYEAHS